MVQLANQYRYNVDQSDHQPFCFGVDEDSDGTSIFGVGSDDDPFVLGTTTKALIRQMARGETFVFHMDATFKTNTCDYPLLVIGMSDASRQFHPIAFFLSSQRTKEQYEYALESVKKVYRLVVGRELHVRYFMGDAEDAQRNAVVRCFGGDISILMCYFHVLYNVKKYTRNLTDEQRDCV
jgi:hypothetical protein